MSRSFVHHVCIQTNSYLETLKFYTEGLGFSLVQESPNFHGRDYNTWLQLGDFYIELQTGKSGEVLSDANTNNQGLVHFCIWVEDLNEEVNRLRSLGIEFLMKNGEYIYQVENGSLCKVKAPEGTIVELRDNRGV
ncbi:VOC family protein [Neobacillus massiliamazoniensis]|uniref:Glyoxalase I n=1 Tax=Neobacillus massiliamazoniensis TaxID=1499688 RepID=A0A0U1P477_9BACI|nr:VOC family protein [Neobacillus massiliamazoniensis]CRK85174.1 glyoxalase I [Neobacillus massiliamazoniensis]